MSQDQSLAIVRIQPAQMRRQRTAVYGAVYGPKVGRVSEGDVTHIRKEVDVVEGSSIAMNRKQESESGVNGGGERRESLHCDFGRSAFTWAWSIQREAPARRAASGRGDAMCMRREPA